MNQRTEAPIRVMALHSITYCERLYYLEEVEQMKRADEAVFAGRTLHEELRQEEEERGEWSSQELSSEALGLTGKVDALRRRDGAWLPYEHKRGRARRENNKAMAWPSDAVQVAAYGMLLEEACKAEVLEGRVRYHKDNVTVRVLIDEALRERVRLAVKQALDWRSSLDRPPVTEHEGRCRRCSLAPVCLPEEERYLEDESRQPLRLFPPDLEKKNLHVQHYSSRVSKKGNTLHIKTEEDAHTFPINEVQALVFHGSPQITTQALHMCAHRQIGVHWLSAGGRYLGSLSAGAGGVQRRIRQYRSLSEADSCLSLAKKLIAAKVENTSRYLLRATRGTDRQETGVEEHLQTIRLCLRSIDTSESPDALRGHEGLAAKAYFATLPTLLQDSALADLLPKGRSRRPPKDRFNALLSFGYSLVYQSVLQAILTVGLEPALGFFHTPRSSAHPLVLDLMELFRLPIWDMALIASVNRGQWDPEEDFSVAGERVWLSSVGRKKAIQLFERRLQDKWRHPVVDGSLTYARLLELEVRLLEKEWSGSPGLFAQMRLR